MLTELTRCYMSKSVEIKCDNRIKGFFPRFGHRCRTVMYVLFLFFEIFFLGHLLKQTHALVLVRRRVFLSLINTLINNSRRWPESQMSLILDRIGNRSRLHHINWISFRFDHDLGYNLAKLLWYLRNLCCLSVLWGFTPSRTGKDFVIWSDIQSVGLLKLIILRLSWWKSGWTFILKLQSSRKRFSFLVLPRKILYETKIGRLIVELCLN